MVADKSRETMVKKYGKNFFKLIKSFEHEHVLDRGRRTALIDGKAVVICTKY